MDKDFLFKFATSNNNYSFKKWGQHDKNCERFMTQQEFFNRTNVKVSEDEFWAINAMYNYCEVDKDEFCKMWCKMNPDRVKAAKKQMKVEKQEEAYKNILSKYYHKHYGKVEDYYVLVAYTNITEKEIQAMSYFGVRFGNAEVVSDVLYKVGKVLGINN